MNSGVQYIAAEKSMKKSTYKPSDLTARCDSKPPAPEVVPDRNVQDSICDHDWQPDGQTMTSNRWICAKCHKSKMTGLDI